ncbi:MAG: prepilin-type N-terminal cleavage/methylation domain-containing protein, partial [Lachnospiraceae bacterium]|nr:prepilin-type N-terminal cleavage/methylation domain-containing protein [Lachnospiraceae bacterium]
MKKNKGFTMVEVMVTIAVMAVLAAIVGITMGILLGQRVKSMAADTKSVLQSTQVVAYSLDDAFVTISKCGSDALVVAFSSAGNEINR